MRYLTRLILFLCLVLLVPPTRLAQTPTPVRTISADYGITRGRHNTYFKEMVGAGRAAEGLRADWQRDLERVHRECGFKYIRFHGLLQDEMGVYREDRQGKPVYNFQNIDVLYDFILKIGMKPFVELSFMPVALASGNKTIFWWKANITPPKDYDKWAALVHALVQHWTERYGEDELRQWYFEVWNEPNLDIFWSGSQTDYFKLYKVTSQAIKDVAAGYRVGGPATAGRGWIRETINFAASNQVPLDFISTHDYGVKGIGFDQGGQQLQLVAEPGAIVDGVRDSRGQITSSALPKLPLHYTEWSTSYSSRDPIHDSYVSAPYILSKLKGAEGYADSLSYWTFTDLFEEEGPAPSPFHGGFGLLNFQGLPKPAFYAYQFLNRLGDVELKSNDAASWVCKSGNAIQVLAWNFTPLVTAESNQIFYKRSLLTKDAGELQVRVTNVPAGKYRLNVYRVGFGVNDVYESYLRIGSPANLSRAQVNDLGAKNDGRPVMSKEVSVDEKRLFRFDIPMRENDVVLLTLSR